MIHACLIPLLVLTVGQAPAPRQPTPDEIKSMMEKTQPGPPHQELAALEGKWSQEVVFDMGAGRVVKASGTASNRMILGGRFLLSESTAKLPASSGLGETTLEGLRIYGFDRRTNEYTIVELDSMGTYWVSAAGSKVDARTVVMSGESLDDHGGTKEMRQYDMVLRTDDPDSYITEIVFKFKDRPDLTILKVLHRRMK